MDNISNNGGDFKMDYISKEENVMVDVFDNSTVRTHTHDFLELAYFVEGEAEHVLNGEKTYIRKGDYLILDYGAYHSYSSKGELKLINCLFHPVFIDKSLVYCRSFNSLLNHYLIKIQSGMLKTSPSNYIFHDTDGTIFPLISRMLYEFRQKQPGYLELIRCNLIELIISTVRKINDNSEFTSSDDTSRMVMKKVNQNYMDHITLGSIAEELEITPGDKVLAIDNTEIEDIFDYQFLTQDTYIEMLVEKADGEQWLLEIDKEFDEDLGIEFENGLMDEYRHCHNKCIFCFIDQMPKGMRDTLYFKDDDSRLSFLQGNYVTLTNMSDHDIDRICRYHLSPINISFQTMNPDLRCKMLNNRFAGEALKKVDILNEAGIRMNGQIVLCKGVNDGKELEFSIQKLMEYLPNVESVSVVPVGLSKYRDGLYPLEPFNAQDAGEVIDLIEKYQKICMEKYGTHFIQASDEWYILAGREVPEEERYDGYLQLENGVGMIRLLLDEFHDGLERRIAEKQSGAGLPWEGTREISLATGKLAFPYLKRMSEEVMQEYPGLQIHVYEIVNEFFGEMITVSGLLTGGDIEKQLKGKKLGDTLYLPRNVLRSGADLFLDDVTVPELEKSLQVPVNIVKSSGYDLVDALLGISDSGQE